MVVDAFLFLMSVFRFAAECSALCSAFVYLFLTAAFLKIKKIYFIPKELSKCRSSVHDHDDGTGHRQLTTSGQARYTIDRER